MAHGRRFRFGVQLASASSGDDWAALARRAEDLGYSTLLLPDHFGDQLAPVPAMQAAADATTDIVGINPAIVTGAVGAEAARNGAADETDRKLEWVTAVAGDRYADLEINMLIFATIITDDPRPPGRRSPRCSASSPRTSTTTPHALIGSVASTSEDLQRRRDRWDVSYGVVQGDAMEALAPVVAALAGT